MSRDSVIKKLLHGFKINDAALDLAEKVCALEQDPRVKKVSFLPRDIGGYTAVVFLDPGFSSPVDFESYLRQRELPIGKIGSTDTLRLYDLTPSKLNVVIEFWDVNTRPSHK